MKLATGWALALLVAASVSLSAATDFAWVEQHREAQQLGQVKTTYLSPPISLRPGDVVNSNPRHTPLKMPEGRFVIKSFVADVVGEDGETAVPLTQVYLHHWVIFTQRERIGPCGSLNWVFGVGAESRGVVSRFDANYGYIAEEYEEWNANLHFLDVRHVPDVKRCIECHCPEGGGGIRCCPDHFRCEVDAEGEKGPALTYHLRYTVEYVPLEGAPLPGQDRNQGFVHVEPLLYDSTPCEIEYNVPACHEADQSGQCVHHQQHEFTVDLDQEVVFMAGHQHIGAANITLEVKTLHDNDYQARCISVPTYGQGTEAGDEKGYVVSISTCDYSDKPLKLVKGDQVRITSLYDNTKTYFDGVMGLFITYSHLL